MTSDPSDRQTVHSDSSPEDITVIANVPPLIVLRPIMCEGYPVMDPNRFPPTKSIRIPIYFGVDSIQYGRLFLECCKCQVAFVITKFWVWFLLKRSFLRIRATKRTKSIFYSAKLPTCTLRILHNIDNVCQFLLNYILQFFNTESVLEI